MTNETTQAKPHPYAQVLQWVSEGREIESHQAFNSEWIPADYDTVLGCAIRGVKSDLYLQPQDFRLKPENKPDTVEYLLAPGWKQEGRYYIPCLVTQRIARCGETNKIKSVELLRD